MIGRVKVGLLYFGVGIYGVDRLYVFCILVGVDIKWKLDGIGVENL